MYGAVFGDIILSKFEFDRGDKSRDFELFTLGDNITDDTVMTVAVAEALLDAGLSAGEGEIKSRVIASMKKWGKKYPDAGYGARFIDWVLSPDPEPYGSYGNGSGMRVSAAGWLYPTIERTREVARWTSEVTHDHPEGIKGAESVAAAVFMARKGFSKAEIADYITSEFGYDLSRTLDEIRPHYHHDETCMRTMPEAFTCFLEASDYESTLRNVAYIGGDADTLGAIAGAVAEAFWGIPLGIRMKGMDYIPSEINAVLERINKVVHPNPASDLYRYNAYIKNAIKAFGEKRVAENYLHILDIIIGRVLNEGQVPAPMVDVNGAWARFDIEKLVPGETFSLKEDVRFRFDKVRDPEGTEWMPLYTDEIELNRQPTTNIKMNVPIMNILLEGYNDPGVAGVIVNPFGQFLKIEKSFLEKMIEIIEKKQDEMNE